MSSNESKSHSNSNLNVLVEIALCAVIALIFDLFIPAIGPLKIDFKMLPIIILSLRRGVGPGITGGLLWGLLQVLMGDAEILTIVQFLLEYFVAFALVGFAGFMSKPLKKTIKEQPTAYGKQAWQASLGLLIGSLSRYVIHFLAGFIFWGQYAPEGQSPVLYSLTVNGTAFLSETITCLVVLLLFTKYYNRLIVPSK